MPFFFDSVWANRVERKIDFLMALGTSFGGKLMGLQESIDNLTREVSEARDSMARAEAKIDAQTAKIEELKAQIAGGNPVTAEQLDALSITLDTAESSLDAKTQEPTT